MSTEKRSQAYYNDIDPFVCAVLKKRIDQGSLAPGRVECADINDVDGRGLVEYDQIHLFAGIGGFALGLALAGWPTTVPVVTAGFPCQPFSGANLGKKRAADSRWLWPAIERCLGDLGQRIVILENVPGFLDGPEFGEVLRTLAALRYDAVWQIVPASAVGAPHKRERLFVVAYPHSIRRNTDKASSGKHLREKVQGRDPDLRPPHSLRLLSDAGTGRMDDGFPAWVDRFRAIGGAVVPQAVAYVAARTMEELGL